MSEPKTVDSLQIPDAATEAERLKAQGNTYYKEGQYEAAIRCYDRALLIVPDFIAAKSNKGFALKKLGRLDEAKRVFIDVLTQDANHQKALFNLADILHKTGDFKEAYKYNERLLSLKPDDIEAQKRRALYLWQIKPVVSCIAVDLKLTKDSNKVKILEYGLGIQSAAVGFEEIYGQSVYQQFVAALADMGLVNHYLGGRFFGGLSSEPLSQEDFDRKQRRWERVGEFDQTDLRAYRGIYCSQQSRLRLPPDVLVLDDVPAIHLGAEDKVLMHEFFKIAGELAVRPNAKIFSKKYTKTLERDIKDMIPDRGHAVLKVADLTRGRGVIFTTSVELSETLKRLFIDPPEQRVKAVMAETAKKMHATGQVLTRQAFTSLTFKSPFMTWMTSINPMFIAEMYERSKVVRYNGKKFDPTMRVWVMVVRDQGKITVNPFAAIWKLPKSPINKKKGDFRDYSISEVRDGVAGVRVKVSDDDFASVKAQLTKSLTAFFDCMLRYNLADFIAERASHDDEAYRNYAWYLYTLYAHILGDLKEYALAHQSIDSSLQISASGMLGDTDLRHISLRERGILFFKQGVFEKAKAVFTECKNKSGSAEMHRWLGKTHIKLGNLPQAKSELAEAIRLDPHDMKTKIAMVELEQRAKLR